MIKHRKSALLAIAALTLSMSVALPAASATAEPAGKYDSYCTGVNGVQQVWTNNKPETCVGWLDIYISGKKVAHVDHRFVGTNRISAKCAVKATKVILSAVAGATPLGWLAIGFSAVQAGITCKK